MAQIEESLKLDTSDAQRDLENLGRIFDQLTSNLSTSLTEALSQLQSVTVGEADATAVSESITEAVDTGAATPVTIEDANADAVSTEITDAVTNAEVPDIVVEGDTVPLVAEVTGAIDGLQGETITVAVQAETSDATEELDAFSEAQKGAEGSIADTATTFSGFTAAVDLAQGRTGSLTSTMGGLKGAAGTSAVAVATLSAFTGALFTNALEAEGATRRFNETTKQFGQSIENVNVGDLNTNISDLALLLGSSDDAIRNAATSQFQLAEASGLAGKESALLSETIIALSARAVALNPALGDVGEVADSLGTALQRGGRFAAGYGIALSGTEIQARAAELAAEGVGDGVSAASLRFAGAQLAIEKYGNQLDQSITRGSQNPIIQLRALATAFGENLEALGAPLVSPVIEILKSSVPIATAVATALTGLVEGALPGVQRVLEGLSELAQKLSPTLGTLGEVTGALLGAVLDGVGNLLDFVNGIVDIVDNLGLLEPLLAGALTAFLAFKALTAVTAAFGAVTAAIGTASTAVAGFGTASLVALGPIGLIAGAVGLAVGAYALFGKGNDEAAEKADEFGKEVLQNVEFVKQFGQEVITAADGQSQLSKAFADYATTTSDFEAENQIKDIREMGLTVQQVEKQMLSGKKGFEDFVRIALDTGEVKRTSKLYGETADDLIAKINELVEVRGVTLKEATGIVLAGNDALIKTFLDEQAAAEASALQTIDNAVVLGQLSQAQRDSAVASATAKDGTLDYNQALIEANNVAAENAAAQKRVEEANRKAGAQARLTAADYTYFATQVAAGNISNEQFAAYADAFGVTTDEIATYVDESATAIQEMGDRFAEAVPSIESGFSKIDEAIREGADPAKILAELQKQQDAIAKFYVNLAIIQEKGGVLLAEQAGKLGPESAAAFAQGIADSTPAQVAALEEQQRQLNATQAANEESERLRGERRARASVANAESLIQVTGQTLNTGFKRIGNEGSAVFERELNFEPAVQGAVTEADRVLREANGTLEASSAETGKQVNAGLARGINENLETVRSAVRTLGGIVSRQLSSNLRVQSPSRVTAEIGKFVAEGLAVGMLEGEQDVIAAANQIVDSQLRALSRTDSQAVGITSAAATVGGGGVTVGQITVTEVANDPVATANAVAYRLGAEAKR